MFHRHPSDQAFDTVAMAGGNRGQQELPGPSKVLYCLGWLVGVYADRRVVLAGGGRAAGAGEYV